MKKYIAEFIGTFVLVFMGCGTAATVGCEMAISVLIKEFSAPQTLKIA